MFFYAEGYHFNVQNGARIAVAEDHNVHTNVLVRESGGPTTPMEQRLRMGMSVR